MKLNQHTKRKNKGMTLLELTVVILVLLSLISILFIGARAWKKGSDRSANILNVRNVQQAVRGHANMNGIAEGDGATAGGAVAATVIFPAYLSEPTPPAPSLAAYTYLGTNPAVGELYITNPASDPEYFYTSASEYAEW
ncbi:prepilin-type N-terminal cleavage/methylation domain-containing protein [Haloferula sp.]|uniref:prepilin-type N-terminal cleavage/methylation domain-containing protein n=1 Tax=Haloferula sp. TaxID=2497595 RepID=UPI003C73F2F8